MQKFAVLLVLLLLPGRVWPQTNGGSPAESLTLQQAIDLALRQNRGVRLEKLEIEKAAERRSVTATRKLPGFDVSVMELQWINPPEFRFDKGVFGVFPGLGPVPPTNTTVTSSYGPSAFILARATQPLTQLHRIGLGLRMNELQRDVAESRLSLKEREVVHQVKRGYYAILQLQSALAGIEDSLKLYRELDRVVGDYVTQQVSLAADSLDIKTQLAKQEYEELRLRDNLAAAREQLNHLLGRDIRTEFAVSEVSTVSAYEVELSAAQSRALAERPELREARLKVQLAEYDHKLKRAERIPVVVGIRAHRDREAQPAARAVGVTGPRPAQAEAVERVVVHRVEVDDTSEFPLGLTEPTGAEVRPGECLTDRALVGFEVAGLLERDDRGVRVGAGEEP